MRAPISSRNRFPRMWVPSLVNLSLTARAKPAPAPAAAVPVAVG